MEIKIRQPPHRGKRGDLDVSVIGTRNVDVTEGPHICIPLQEPKVSKYPNLKHIPQSIITIPSREAMDTAFGYFGPLGWE